jgi:hypothetical protein
MTQLLTVTTALVSLVFLALDLWPGAIAFTMLCPVVCCATLPALYLVSLAWVGVVGLTFHRQRERGVRVSPTVVACVAWMTGCGVLVLSDIPRLAAFSFYRDEFESLAATAPTAGEKVSCNRWVGCFYIDEYAADKHGAVYFRTVSHADGIGPDTMSYGFVLRPNRSEGTPFGWSSYRQSHLIGDWYSFGVSDD